jgi:hypothetical protein
VWLHNLICDHNKLRGVPGIAQSVDHLKADRHDMNPRRETRPDKQAPTPLSPTEEVRRVLEEYAKELREIIKKLRKHIFH